MPRHQKTPPPGTRPAPPSEGTWPVGYVAAGAPLLVVASLVGGDGVDGTTVSFLLRENLKLQDVKEEEERKRRERREVLLVEFRAMQAVPFGRRSPAQVSRLQAVSEELDDIWAAPSSQPGRRKRRRRGSFPNPLPFAPLAPGNLDIFTLRLWHPVPVATRFDSGHMFMRQFSRLLVLAWVFQRAGGFGF